MNAQLVVIIAGVLLLIAIIGSLVFLRSYQGRFTFDTRGGTRPKASEGEGDTSQRTSLSRFKVLSAGVGTVFAALVAKLWTMQMVSSDYYEELSQKNQTRTVTTPAPRGRILDRNGVALVDNRPSLTVVAYRDLAEDTLTVRHLANVLGMPYVAVLRNIQDNTEGAQSMHTIASDVRRSTVAYIQEHIDMFPGVSVVERTEREYPYGTLACHVLGYTGTITQEQLDAQKEAQESDSSSAITYQSGDIVGQSGVEAQYETLLQGIRGEQTVKVDANGNVTAQAGAVPAEAGNDIKLTLDLKVQQACEDGLKLGMETAQRAGSPGTAGACICIDCTNGEILGMASAPNYDPSAFVGGISSDLWSEFNDDEGGKPLVNRVISGLYPSASTIKPLSAIAGIEYGVYGPERSSVCSGWWTGLGEGTGKWCWLHKGHGTRGLETGIRDSCDVVFYELGRDFFNSGSNSEGLQEVFRRFGLGSKTGIDLPNEGIGRVPDAAWKESYFKDWSAEDRAWNAGDMTNIAIGQGDVLVTPLQMALAYCGVAQNGKEMKPHILLSALSRDGKSETYTYEPKERLNATVNNSQALPLVQSGLHRMIYEESQSIAYHFRSVPVEVAGKTGTAEKTGEEAYGWFIAYAPYDDPKYVITGMVEQGGYGSTCALPIVRTVLGALYDCPTTADFLSNNTDQSR